MDSRKKKPLFLGAILLLLVILVAVSVVVILQGPRTSTVQVVSKGETDGQLVVDDLYEGKMTIPKYDIPTNTYLPDKFEENNGVVTYDSESATIGINVNEQQGTINWAAVKESGVDYAMIRVGYRGKKKGLITPDKNFEDNMKGAQEANVPVGVYFYSKAVTDAEALEEATFVMERIKAFQIAYPVAIYWEYNYKDDGSLDETARTTSCNGDQVTSILGTFCKKIKDAGYAPLYYADKTMGYEKLDLEKLSSYGMWYAEYKKAPSFYYDFSIWQYTKDAEVSGIEGKVPVNIALKKYG